MSHGISQPHTSTKSYSSSSLASSHCSGDKGLPSGLKLSCRSWHVLPSLFGMSSAALVIISPDSHIEQRGAGDTSPAEQPQIPARSTLTNSSLAALHSSVVVKPLKMSSCCLHVRASSRGNTVSGSGRVPSGQTSHDISGGGPV